MSDATKHFNSLPDENIFDLSKFKAFAEDYINVNKKLKFDLGWVEKWEKGKMLVTCTSIFSQCPLQASFSRSSKKGIVW